MTKTELIKELTQIRTNHSITRFEMAKLITKNPDKVLKVTRDLDDLETLQPDCDISVAKYQLGLKGAMGSRKIAPNQHEKDILNVKPKIVKMYPDYLPSRA